MTSTSRVRLRAGLPRQLSPAHLHKRRIVPVDDESVAATVRGMFGRDSIYLSLWILQLGLAALFTPVTTRLLGSSRFGLVASSIAIMQVLVAIGSVGLQNAVQHRYAAPGGERDARRLVMLAIAISMATFAVADFTGPVWSSALGLGPYPLAVRYAVGWASMTAISNAALGLLRSRDQLVPFATVSLMQSVVAEALSLTFILLIRRTAAEYVLGQLVAQVAAVVVSLAVTRPLLLRGHDLEIVRNALWFAIPLVPASLAAFVLDASDRLVLQHDLGSAAVARYAVARNIGAIPIMMLSALNTVWMPRVFALGDRRVRDSVLAQSRDALYALLIPVIIGLGLCAPILLRIWAPPSYQPDSLVGVVAIVATTSVAYAGGLSHTRTLLAAGRTLPISASTLVAAAINFSLNIVTVPVLGIYGSALATLASYVMLQAMLAVAARASTRLRSPHPALVASVITAMAIVFLAVWLPMSPVFLAIRVAGGVGCVVVFGAMTCALAGRPALRRMRRIGEPLIFKLGVAAE